MILVDPRVGSKQFVEPIAKRVKCPVRFAKPMLESGDVMFDGLGPENKDFMIGIEIKRLGDMLGSMRSGRLAGDQLVKMSKTYDMSYLIIQGLWRPDDSGVLTVPRRVQGKNKWVPLDLAAKDPTSSVCFRYAELDKYIASLEVIKNIVVVRSTSELETTWNIVNRYNWWQKPWDEHSSTDPIKTQTEIVFGGASLLRKMAAELPGIGWTRSAAVERAFISVFHMMNAPVESWESIEGIGPKTARKVWQVIRERNV